MRQRKSRLFIAGLILLGVLCSSLSVAFSRAFLKSDEFKGYSEEQQRAIRLIVEHKDVRLFLTEYGSWRAETYADSEVDWHVDFYIGDEWIGYAHINVDSKELYDALLPRELSPEAYEQGKEKIENLVLADAEIVARLGDPLAWDYSVEFDKYDQTWTMYFWRGIESMGISFYEEDSRFYIDNVFNPDALVDEELEQEQRNQAIELAYSAEGLEAALEGVDYWVTYAERQEETLWTVEFAAPDQSLMTVLVNIEAWEVLEASRP